MWPQQKNKTHFEFVVTSVSVTSAGISGDYVSKNLLKVVHFYRIIYTEDMHEDDLKVSNSAAVFFIKEGTKENKKEVKEI